ncbi:MAG: acyl-CoA dehydrogenase family protein [Deltaproteobacteria bacterium]|nr:acyl-CoA dehydrogenase family protein [Deltaproteobacteria bacterium]
MGWANGFSFELPEEVRMAQEAARDFAESEVLPLAAKIDQEHYFPRELLPKLGALGFMGVAVPPELDGAGLSQIAYCLIIEELAAACASTAIIVSAHNSLCISPLLEYGSEEQRSAYLPKLARGEWLGCFALSEPSTGSDAANLTCTVKKQGKEYVINGTKNWITNAPEADVCILFAMQEPAKGNKGITAFVHSMKTEGISLGKREDKMGIRGSPTSSIMYDDVKLGQNNLLFEEGRGFAVAMSTLNGGRIGVASQAVGIARAALRDALNYANERKAFGKLIAEHQSIQNYLCDMITRIDAARYLTLSAAALKDQGKSYGRQASMAKLFASEAAMEAAVKGIQIHGGYGYVTEYPAERHLRDAKITEIYEGTSEIQRIIVATNLLKEQY